MKVKELIEKLQEFKDFEVDSRFASKIKDSVRVPTTEEQFKELVLFGNEEEDNEIDFYDIIDKVEEFISDKIYTLIESTENQYDIHTTCEVRENVLKYVMDLAKFKVADKYKHYLSEEDFDD